jgi:hypothetical protein
MKNEQVNWIYVIIMYIVKMLFKMGLLPENVFQLFCCIKSIKLVFFKYFSIIFIYLYIYIYKNIILIYFQFKNIIHYTTKPQVLAFQCDGTV